MSDAERLKALNTKLTRACIASHDHFKEMVACFDIPIDSDEHRTLALLEEVLIEAAAYRKENRKPMQGLTLVGAEEVKA